ncbi:MAG: hypothetical protein AAF411_03440 [Myxococcota bacterium]
MEDSWRLLPSERVIWEGRPANVPRSRGWALATVMLVAVAIVTACFAALLKFSGMAGVSRSMALCAMCLAGAIGTYLWPRHRLDQLRYALTDRRVLLRRGQTSRFIDVASITYARIRWHRASPVVGHLELVVATPFGPLRRPLRVVLEDVREPDRLWARIRGASARVAAGDATTPLVERLDEDEQLEWSGRPLGLHLGWRELGVAASGLAVTALGFLYAQRNITILLDLEGLGLSVKSPEWALLFSAALISAAAILAVGITLLWQGLVRSRLLGEQTEYVLTSKRLLIRRGFTELSLDRRRIVDVAEQRAPRGLVHLFFVLDGPGARALAVSGAMGPVLPARDAVPPVLFDVAPSSKLRGFFERAAR